MKVEVDFPSSFELNCALPIPIGRIYLGPYTGRLVFYPDGKVRLYVPRAAIDEGYVVVGAYMDPVEPVGFGAAP